MIVAPGPVSAFAGTVWGEFAPIYRALAQLGIGPRDADDLELWEIAAVLGVDLDSGTVPLGQPDQRAILRARVEAAEHGTSAPQWGGDLTPREVAELELITAGKQGSL